VREPVVIRQDEQTELHVQAVIQSGRRQLDIRVWRRGPTGFAPSQSALTLEAADVDALCEGVTELLEVSNGGTQVARVVWDKDEGRRLRAETEPFGTRFMARLGFWQRVRDTWRPADAGLVLDAEQLERLKKVIAALRPRLQDLQPDDGASAGIGLQPTSLLRWPSPGADWLTSEPGRLAFHPRGIHITATVEEDGGEHRLGLRQWRRAESLWLPEEGMLLLDVPAIDALLSGLHDLADGHEETVEVSTDGTAVHVERREVDGKRMLVVEERLGPPEEYRLEPRLSMPAEYLARLGRMLAQAGMMLISRLSADERATLHHQQGPEIAPAIVSDALVPPTEQIEEQEEVENAGDLLAAELEMDGPAAEDQEQPRRLVPLGEIQLGRHFVFLYLEEQYGRFLSFQWDGYALLVPIDEVQPLLEQLRALYYDAVRGRRGQITTSGAGPDIHLSAQSQGSTTMFAVQQENEGKVSRLTFPAGDVPSFLSAATAAMKKVQTALANPPA
jgi:hypothetical protein